MFSWYLQQEILKQKQEQVIQVKSEASMMQIKNEPGTPTYDEDWASSVDVHSKGKVSVPVEESL